LSSGNPVVKQEPIAEVMLRVVLEKCGHLLDAMDEIRAKNRFTWLDDPTRKIDPRVHYPADMTSSLDWADGHRPSESSGSITIAKWLHAFGNYRRTRTVYTIDRTLLNHLVDSKWPEAIPMEAAALPKNGCVLDFPAHEIFGADNIQDTDRIQVICTYDMNLETHGLDMILTPICLNRKRGMIDLIDLSACINMSSASLEDSMLDYAIFAEEDRARRLAAVEEGWKDDGGASQRLHENRLYDKNWSRYLKTILSVLLYINGNDDLLELEQPKAGPMNKAKMRRQAKESTSPTAGQERPPRQFVVGRRFASIIQRWVDQESADAERTGRAMRPHLRAAHAHLYRIGKGRTGHRVRFLPPIPVGGWEAPEATPANRLVK